MKLPAILKNRTSVAAIYVEQSALLQRCRRPFSSQHKLANLIVLAYMAVGLALPLGGLAGCILAVAAWAASLAKTTVPTVVTGTLMCIGSLAMFFATIWLLMTPLALIITAVQRRFVGLVAPLMCAGWYGFVFAVFGISSAFPQTKELPHEIKGGIVILTFLVGAYYGVKCNLKVIRDIRTEGADWVPEVLGCKKAHTADTTTGS